MLARAVAAVVAFCLGWTVYMIAMVLTVYDGILSMILQPFMAAVVSGICVVAALMLGLLLRMRPLSRWWTATSLWAALVAGGSVFILAFGYFLGLTHVGTNPETGREIVTLHPVAAAGAYFCLVFAVANWPIRRRRGLREVSGRGDR
jgi:drug/metabolite transporter (DMT)-like permease